MKIQEGKIETISKDEIFDNICAEFYGNSENIAFVKKAGILDCIFQIAADSENGLQNIIDYAARIANPEEVSGIWQDALYERLGVYRLAPMQTGFSIVFTGLPNATIDAQAILISDENSNCEFLNNEEFSFDSSGNAVVNVQSDKYENILVTERSSFRIVRAPRTVYSLDNSTISNIVKGHEKESDEDYRLRFKNSKALNSRATSKANHANLNKYVNSAEFLNIVKKNNDISMAPFNVMVIAKHNTTDKIFAEAIFETFGAGITFWGNTSVLVKDLMNNDVIVKFQKAEEIPMSLHVKVLSSPGYNFSLLTKNIKSEILSYIKKRNFGLNSTVYANEFIVPIYNLEGVEAVIQIKIKKREDSSYADSVRVNQDEIPEFSPEQILVEGV